MDDPILNEELKENVQDSSVWKRLLFMLLFGFLYSVAEVVLFAVIVFQFLTVLLTGNKNDRLLDLGDQISTYIYQALRYLTYNTEQRPYPFSDWPDRQAEAEVAEKAAPGKATSEENAPGKAEPEKTEPEETAPEKVEPEKAEPEEVAPEQIETEVVASEEPVPKKASPRKTVPKKPAARKTTPRKATPRKAAAKKPDPEKSENKES